MVEWYAAHCDDPGIAYAMGSYEHRWQTNEGDSWTEKQSFVVFELDRGEVMNKKVAKWHADVVPLVSADVAAPAEAKPETKTKTRKRKTPAKPKGGIASSMLGRTTSALLVFILTASSVSAGPILSSALRLAAGIVPAVAVQADCEEATARGEEAGEESASWMRRGLIPLVGVFYTAVARNSQVTPPRDALSSVDPADRECWTAGYTDATRSKRVRTAWTGALISTGGFMLLSSAIREANDTN